MELSGTTALVTGGARRVGRAIALGLALLGSIGAERIRLWLVPKLRSPRAAILAGQAGRPVREASQASGYA